MKLLINELELQMKAKKVIALTPKGSNPLFLCLTLILQKGGIQWKTH